MINFKPGDLIVIKGGLLFKYGYTYSLIIDITGIITMNDYRGIDNEINEDGVLIDEINEHYDLYTDIFRD